jgi:hypothetical protein
MYFIVEFEGTRKSVQAKRTASVANVFALAFGGDDTQCSKMRVIGSTTRKDVAAGMMCKVWPVAEDPTHPLVETPEETIPETDLEIETEHGKVKW